MRRGLYRVRGVDGRPDDVRVDDDGIEFPVEEQLYQARGYLPVLEDLPWQEDHLRKQPLADTDARREQADAKAAREQARQEFRARFRSG